MPYKIYSSSSELLSFLNSPVKNQAVTLSVLPGYSVRRLSSQGWDEEKGSGKRSTLAPTPSFILLQTSSIWNSRPLQPESVPYAERILPLLSLFLDHLFSTRHYIWLASIQFPCSQFHSGLLAVTIQFHPGFLAVSSTQVCLRLLYSLPRFPCSQLHSGLLAVTMQFHPGFLAVSSTQVCQRLLYSFTLVSLQLVPLRFVSGYYIVSRRFPCSQFHSGLLAVTIQFHPGFFAVSSTQVCSRLLYSFTPVSLQ